MDDYLSNSKLLSRSIHKSGTTASVDFVIGHQANKAYAVVNNQPLEGSDLQIQCPLPMPEPRTGLLIKSLPSDMTESDVFDRFASFGPIYSCSVISKASSTEVTATVQFFLQQDAHMALQEMHCSDIDGQLISVSPMDLQSKRSSKNSNSSASSTERAPSKPRTQLNVSAVPFNPSAPTTVSRKDSVTDDDTVTATSPLSLQQHFIDYCNLYVKNLDEALNSTDLFQHFKSYGRIVSARVIVNAATNQSRGYGFVSYSRPEEAAFALNQMNGAVLGSKPILVAYHEPKKPRVLPVSPKSPGTSESGSQVASLPPPESTAYESSDLYQDLYNSVVGTGIVWESNLNQVTESLSKLPRQEQVALLTQPLLLLEKVKEIRDGLGLSPVIEIPVSRPINIRSPSETSHPDDLPKQTPQSASSSIVSSPISQNNVLSSLIALPGRSSDSISQRLGGQDGTSTPGSTVSDQRDRMIDAIQQIDPTAEEEIIDMLMTLSSKERSLCIFNPEYLRSKISQARDALNIFADEDESPNGDSRPAEAKEDNSAEAFYLKISKLSLFEKKQKLGDKLYPLVKATGVKQAPKVTIRLLDTVDLHRLSKLMTVDNSELSSLAKSAYESL
ncbi:hypothetical protein K450DRAFT_218407 [Umbelopsis ramanniana AG]|uniref:RRM domain-containing protein n=1 Tax=Umbelopsis ramanniana AG TaxID=1314678 RepID=A0AAD5EJC2_UMBRA|nr:uncharacterized protein K450DRAFT_218407 [Umbelopsis ramanniana AG]KAI8584150.1 hypothetical protein K450DRAFT_218407 [Umbelopsis ramanniana AG]